MTRKNNITGCFIFIILFLTRILMSSVANKIWPGYNIDNMARFGDDQCRRKQRGFVILSLGIILPNSPI